MKRLYNLIFLSMGLASQSCMDMDVHCTYDTIRLPKTPLNLTIVNSPYDDWNCGIPWEEFTPGMAFLFSSNRTTQGKTFDLVPHNFWIKGAGNLDIMGSAGDSLSITDNFSGLDEKTAQMRQIARRVRTSQDELGPLFLPTQGHDDTEAWSGGLAYSRGDSVNHDLRLLSARTAPFEFLDDTLWAQGVVDSALTAFNTEADEGYLAYSDSVRAVLFHSNREGRYHIYQASIPDSVAVLDWLTSRLASAEVTRVDALMGTDGEERCPSLHGDTLLFVSDRSGGQGGLDIYRSVWDGKQWSKPINLGAAVNSISDEYRPVLLSFGEGPGILFSSDRSGGQGGFDLYLVKMP
jgi:hypothetical protein